MNKIPNDQRGFTLVEGLLIILILVVIGAVGYMVYHNDHKTKAASVSTSSTKTASTSSASASVTQKTYSNQAAGFTFQYPSNWINVATEEPLVSGSFAGVSGVITAPDNNKLVWIFQEVGGKGGDCSPTAGDVAFASGNNCASKQIISVQQLPGANSTSNTQAKSMFEDNLYITETKYDPGSTALPALYPGMPTYAANSTSYQICLDPSYSTADGGNPPTTGTSMELLFPCAYWDTGLNAVFPVKSPSDFNSSDAQTAIKIMKSFNTL